MSGEGRVICDIFDRRCNGAIAEVDDITKKTIE